MTTKLAKHFKMQCDATQCHDTNTMWQHKMPSLLQLQHTTASGITGNGIFIHMAHAVPSLVFEEFKTVVRLKECLQAQDPSHNPSVYIVSLLQTFKDLLCQCVIL